MSKPFPKCNAAADYLQQKTACWQAVFEFQQLLRHTVCRKADRRAAIPATAGNGMPYTDHPEPKLW